MSRELNLVPKVYNQIKVEKKKKRSAVVGILLIVLVLLLGFGYTFGQQFYLEYQKKTLTEEIEKSKALMQKDGELTTQINMLKEHINKATSLQALRSKSTDGIFLELQKLFPPTVSATNVSYNKVNITMSGTAASREAIEELWANLRESKDFKNAHISSISPGDAPFTFSLEINLVGGVEDGVK